MSTEPPSTPPPGAPAVPVYEVAPPGAEHKRKIDYIVVYGHSNLLYWWPVWLVSFILAAVTYFEGHQMAVIPDKTIVEKGVEIPGLEGPRDALVAPPNEHFSLAPQEGRKNAPAGMTVSSSNTLGVIFVAVLLLVALASTILLRGLVSLVALIALFTLVILFALLGWWNNILGALWGLDIRMNAAGYLCVAVPLFVAWCLVVFIYDRAHYVAFDQGQIRYVLEVGDSEVVMQSEGAVVEKKRNDVFRHWLLGFGTGDLVIRTGGGRGQTIELENVINIDRKLTIINKMVREKAITIDTGE